MTDVQKKLIAILPGKTRESLAIELLPTSWERTVGYWEWYDLLPASFTLLWDDLSDEAKLVAYIIGSRAADLANSHQAENEYNDL